MKTTVSNIRIVQINENIRQIAAFIVCLICLALFVISAYEKIVDHERFLRGLSRVKLVGQYAVFISYFVPASKIIVSLLLINPATQRWGLWGFTGLMGVFTLYIGSMIFWAEKLPCNCNLIIEKLDWGQHLWLNMGFLVLVISALWLGRAKRH
ncbi:MauE/DoxX family redox-associated membrane protein [Pedobacter psychroterrae]|uniref:Methylamine utilisation protein MauE domain-containing protein n=1 Tax=Pedobacter psychroterrae TaxID=2530453 RepID=A0A4R0NPK5_9SPHI|nr:MauE/DoxX family redox-associated membrane protein [Pedobacter psychroterrae]TCD02726.1 hypothetical protein EZ437_01685 [Pedobacter psychroterrae]